jgi:hypothetical protein
LGNQWLYGAGLVNATAAADTPVVLYSATIADTAGTDNPGIDDGDGVPFSPGQNLAEASA